MKAMKTSTIYQKSIKSPIEFQTLKKGSGNKKLGFKVTSKKWGGKRLYSLTLGLLPKLEEELRVLNDKHPQGIVVRLHVLGDFMSVEYVKFWETMMLDYPNLCIFGYTGRELDSKIGMAIHMLNLRYSERFVVRFSRNFDSTETGKSFAANESFEGKSFDCPEQTGKVKNCASCGLCWTTTKTVRFLSH